MPAIEDFVRQIHGVDLVDATEVHAVFARETGCFMEGVDAATFAKMVSGGSGAELVEPQRIVRDLHIQLLEVVDFDGHRGTLARTDRAIAAQCLVDFLSGV